MTYWYIEGERLSCPPSLAPSSSSFPLEKACTLKDDEVLLILAQELGQPAFSSLVRNPVALLPTLTNLAGTEETVVREAAVASLLTYVGKERKKEGGREGGKECWSFLFPLFHLPPFIHSYLPLPPSFPPSFRPSLPPSLLPFPPAESSPPSPPPSLRASPPSCRWHKAKCSATRFQPPRSSPPSTSNSRGPPNQGRGRGRGGWSS